MPAQATDSGHYGFTDYIRRGLLHPSPKTLLFVISVFIFFVSVAGSVVYYYSVYGALPRPSLYVLTEGELRFQRGDIAGALKEFEGAVSVSPATSQYLMNLGVAANAAGDKAGAIDAFERVLRFRAYDPDANYFLGLLYLERNQLDAAITHISRSIEARPTSEAITAYNDLGVAYARKGDLEKAAESYQRALAIDPNYRAAQENLSSLRRRMP
jgi:tetratricopeptide (TPR) repeat protein